MPPFRCLPLLLLWTVGTAALAWPVDPAALVTAARGQIGVTLGYDPAYRRLAYPGGDVDPATGVCTDVVIRALRRQGIDLQREVHQDMRANFAAYPRRWGLARPDPNIDHRRVPNLMTFLTRRGHALPLPADGSADPRRFRPGDVVTWRLDNGLPHIGLVSDRIGPSGAPLVIHNIGAGTREEDSLFRFALTGHYRLTPRR